MRGTKKLLQPTNHRLLLIRRSVPPFSENRRNRSNLFVDYLSGTLVSKHSSVFGSKLKRKLKFVGSRRGRLRVPAGAVRSRMRVAFWKDLFMRKRTLWRKNRLFHRILFFAKRRLVRRAIFRARKSFLMKKITGVAIPLLKSKKKRVEKLNCLKRGRRKATLSKKFKDKKKGKKGVGETAKKKRKGDPFTNVSSRPNIRLSKFRKPSDFVSPILRNLVVRSLRSFIRSLADAKGVQVAYIRKNGVLGAGSPIIRNLLSNVGRLSNKILTSVFLSRRLGLYRRKIDSDEAVTLSKFPSLRITRSLHNVFFTLVEPGTLRPLYTTSLYAKAPSSEKNKQSPESYAAVAKILAGKLSAAGQKEVVIQLYSRFNTRIASFLRSLGAFKVNCLDIVDLARTAHNGLRPKKSRNQRR